MKRWLLPTIALTLLAALTTTLFRGEPAWSQEMPKPIRALLVIGGCCHDYAKQKEILKAGLAARANVSIDEVYSAVVIDQAVTADKTDKPS